MQKDIFVSAIRSFKKIKILVVGDIMLDHYIYGEVLRISPEAPVPILRKTSENYFPGGAGNVAYNLAALGARVSIAGIVGKDYHSQILKELFIKADIDSGAILETQSRLTTIKERFISKTQHILRLDTEDISNFTVQEEKKLLEMIKGKINNCDGIILSDYAKGLFSKSLAQVIIKKAKNSKKPIFADIKPANKEYFRGVNSVTPNLKEALDMTKTHDIYHAGKLLRDYYNADITITKGEGGISIFRKNNKQTDFPARSTSVVDISGAGDTFISVQTLGVLAGLDLEDAGYLANTAAAIVVQKSGTATLTSEELESSTEENNHIEMINIVPKLWGYEKWLENNQKYCCKLLSINKDYQSSLHYHKEKDEMFFVTKGYVRLESNGKVLHMREGNFMRIKPGTKHRFTGLEDSIIIEVSTHHDESDSYRIEKSRKII